MLQRKLARVVIQSDVTAIHSLGRQMLDMPGHGGVLSDQLCMLPGEVDIAGGMSIKAQNKVTKNVQTGA